MPQPDPEPPIPPRVKREVERNHTWKTCPQCHGTGCVPAPSWRGQPGRPPVPRMHSDDFIPLVYRACGLLRRHGIYPSKQAVSERMQLSYHTFNKYLQLAGLVWPLPEHQPRRSK